MIKRFLLIYLSNQGKETSLYKIEHQCEGYCYKQEKMHEQVEQGLHKVWKKNFIRFPRSSSRHTCSPLQDGFDIRNGSSISALSSYYKNRNTTIFIKHDHLLTTDNICVA